MNKNKSSYCFYWPFIVLADDAEPVEDAEQPVELLLLPVVRQSDPALPEEQAPDQLLNL